jgi:transposase
MFRKGAGGRFFFLVEERVMFGIDVSKASLVCTLLDPETQKVVWEATAANSVEGIQQLLQTVPAQVPWVLEPTGRYSALVVHLATAAGRKVLQATPREARFFLKSRFPRAKTDRVDSCGLALFALSQPLRPFPVKSDAVEQLEQLLRARRGLAQSLTDQRQRREELPHAAARLQQVIEGLEEQLKQLDAEIHQLVADEQRFPEVARLDAVPGIGILTAATVTACLKARQFAHPDRFVAYIGLDLIVRDSGQSRGRRALSHRGDAEIRRLLYLAAQANLRCKSSPFRDQYERERAKGLTTTQALCAVARKLARVCWSLVQHEADYDPQRVYRQEHQLQTATAN